MAFKFVKYDADELRRAGKEFCSAVDGDAPIDQDWTTFVLRRFHEACADGHTAWPPTPGSRAGEFMWDQCHINRTGPQTHEGWLAWYDRVMTRSLQMSLVLESEWGKRGTRALSVEQVLDDALKLAFARARAKVMIFASRDEVVRGEFVDRLKKLRDAVDDTAPWLWVDIPWSAAPGRPSAAYGVFP